MKVILLEEVKGKGGEGDVVEVTRGFANNYLLKNGMAVKATEGNLKQLEQRRKNIAKREAVRISNAEALKEQLEGAQITIKAKVGEEGQLFGSITPQIIADALKEQKDVEIDRRRIDIHKPIREIGDHAIEISLYRDIKAAVDITVVDEAGVQVAEQAAPAEPVDEAAAEEAAAEAAVEALPAESEESATEE